MIGALKLSLATMVALGVVTSQAAALCATPKNLSGMYKSNDGGTYFLRRAGDVVWWMGRSSDDGRSWTNVFRGTLNGDTFEGNWSDVIHNNGNGRLTLRMIGSIETGVSGFDRIGGSGDGFGGEHWRRPCNDTN